MYKKLTPVGHNLGDCRQFSDMYIKTGNFLKTNVFSA
jgi:hypothetical protein